MESADKEAQMGASGKNSPTVLAWIAGIGSLFFWNPILSTTQQTALGTLGVLLLGVGGPILTGILTAKIVRSIIKNNLEEELITSMKKKEKETLDTIL
jgi:hypothetical protein